MCYLQFTASGNGHAVLGVFINAAHHHSAAVASEQGSYFGKTLFTILKVNGVDHALALQPLQSKLRYCRISGVDHDWCPHLLGQIEQHLLHIGSLITIRVGYADINHLGAGLDLGPGNLGRFFKLTGHDHVFELAGADHVGSLTHQDRAVILFNKQRFNAGDQSAAGCNRFTGLPACCHFCNGRNMGR